MNARTVAVLLVAACACVPCRLALASDSLVELLQEAAKGLQSAKAGTRVAAADKVAEAIAKRLRFGRPDSATGDRGPLSKAEAVVAVADALPSLLRLAAEGEDEEALSASTALNHLAASNAFEMYLKSSGATALPVDQEHLLGACRRGYWVDWLPLIRGSRPLSSDVCAFLLTALKATPSQHAVGLVTELMVAGGEQRTSVMELLWTQETTTNLAWAVAAGAAKAELTDAEIRKLIGYVTSPAPIERVRAGLHSLERTVKSDSPWLMDLRPLTRSPSPLVAAQAGYLLAHGGDRYRDVLPILVRMLEHRKRDSRLVMAAEYAVRGMEVLRPDAAHKPKLIEVVRDDQASSAIRRPAMRMLAGLGKVHARESIAAIRYRLAHEPDHLEEIEARHLLEQLSRMIPK